MTEYVRLGVGLVILAAIAVTVLTVAGVPQRRAVLTASLRAVVQLTIIAAALRGVFAAPWAVVLVMSVMFGVSTFTAARRLRVHSGAARAVVLSCAAGASVTIAIIVGMPTLDRDVRTLVAVSGIVFGNCMVAAVLTGRRLTEGLVSRRDEVEGWLAIGATARQAVLPIARYSVFEALVPGLDQTRTVGLVTLPGAFVGALLGGASASAAAKFQIVVLVGLLCAQSITATALAWQLGAPRTLPEPEHAQ
ncbi:ABC transporter permease [Rhodococcus sp. D2-41]|uniref:ABC transporter permease n=1 Tax=Speluncibacter jeojiensis TaxID=2710754 RepID=A0A9X4LXP5_9ACTN|nr:ABC transporter permease [Rhodococcus sp. D2-41]MDG3010531.1 ABC transporter permease [Rhodococcus sp. D2-41]MDG3014280.1 ABC transporter permease [Corynebacteriales bacterium D3-21]